MTNPNPQPTRRSLLAAVGAVGLAGCLSVADEPTVDGSAQAKIADGFAAEGVDPPLETTIYTNAETEARTQWAQLVRDELNDTALFDISLQETEWARHLEILTTMEAESRNALVCLNVSSGWEPDALLRTLAHSTRTPPKGFNLNGYENATVDEQLEAGRQASDQDRRRELYDSIDSLLSRDRPFSPICFQDAITVTRTELSYTPSPIGGTEYTPVYAPWSGLYADPSDGERTLEGDIPAPISTTDPVEMTDTTALTATSLIYEGLVAADFEGTVKPALATNWEQLDATTYRFELREGVQFHNGESFTAAHVEHSLERFTDTPMMDTVAGWYDSTEIIGEYELEIHLSQEYSPFEYHVGQSIVPLAAGDDGDLDLSSEPVGTGPYQLQEHEPGERWQVEAFEDHWFAGDDTVPATPPFETVTLRVIPDSASRQAALETGELDLLTQPPLAAVSAFEANPEFDVQRATTGTLELLAYPTYNAPFGNKDVRHGIDALLPRDRIVEEVYHEYATPTDTLLSPLTEAFIGSSSEND